MKKPYKNRITYNNGGILETGQVNKKIDKKWLKLKGKKVPRCDTLYLRIREGGKKPEDNYFTLTIDEFYGLIMLMSETYWYSMKRVNRN